uniref:NADH-ubiquinone oxidoreductase chain 6 n=1 Tax=Appias remedios TaxID=2315757 RepID=A0A3B1EW53_9NEOP|nr:NADH dehydrogenase subunit 6 [Appias remedios]YP_010852831.1 NADH dehydrogenase subunit 6 [Appias lalage]AXU98834.1 NADH dehydrogenase subunit 6 [Appias remedios]WGL40250.1 NADH dehydrogenase subunit 6 [Appias lalage]
MLELFLSMSMISISLLMYFITHPLAMGLLILCQTLILSLMLGIFINTYWFSYILFLIFLGGLLVLFIYVSSIASNELMNFSLKFKFILMLYFLLFLLTYFLIYNFYLKNSLLNNEMINFNQYFMFFNENKISLTKLYNNQTFLLIIMLIIYLFITLIAVIKITNIFFGPLRSFN